MENFNVQPLSTLRRRILHMGLIFLLFLKSGWCIECYVCSYSPLNHSMRIDVCTDSNFTAESVDARPCETGCEAVSVLDSNGNLENFHRNCASTRNPVTNDCVTSNKLLFSRTVCTCDWNFCNASSRSSTSSALCVLLGTIVVAVYNCDLGALLATLSSLRS